jgi:DNA-directed RNA polymerase subunit RPC12/RpoP
MDQRVFHGPITPEDLAAALVAEFDRGNLQAQVVSHAGTLIVQIGSRMMRASGGETALSVHLSPVEDGVLARVGQQEWLGVAASLGATALGALRNPLTLLGRLDDLAQDITSLQLSERVWQTLARSAESLGASHEISERLRRITCSYCLSANPVGTPQCIACGAPLGPDQPVACPHCGHVVKSAAGNCPQCGKPLRA